MTRDISFSHHRFQLSMHATTSPFITMNYKFIHGNSLLSFISDFVGYLSTSVPPLSVGCCLKSLLVVWDPYSFVPLLSVSCWLSSLLSCTFTICGLLFELFILLFLHFLSGVVWVPYSVVPLLPVGWCLSSLLSCSFTFCGLLFDVPTLLLWVVVWCPYSVVPSRTVGCCLMSILCCSFTNCGLLFELHTLLFLHEL